MALTISLTRTGRIALRGNINVAGVNLSAAKTVGKIKKLKSNTLTRALFNTSALRKEA